MEIEQGNTEADNCWKDHGISRHIDVAFKDVSLHIFVDMNVGIGGDKWPAAELFCNVACIPKWKAVFGDIFNGKRIIELGSGNGMVGIFLSLAFSPSHVLITDLAEYLPLIQHNIEVNGCRPDMCQCSGFDWLNPPNLGTFDIICGFECVYREELYQPFIDSLRSCFHSTSVAFIGMTREFAKPKFFSLLSLHFRFTMLPIRDEPDISQSGNEVALLILRLA